METSVRIQTPSLFQGRTVEPFSNTLNLLAENMLASMDLQRKDRLWPADPIIFQTNPMNLAYGVCGTALFLFDQLGELPNEVRQWMLDQPIDVNVYPPGLYSGIAGVAWSFAEMGMIDYGKKLFRLVLESPLAFQSFNIFGGAAGWGLAALALYQRTGEDEFLGYACRAGDYLLKTSEQDENGTFWREEDGIRLGFALGGSGVALFLLYLWQATGDAKYLVPARQAMDYEVAHGQAIDDAIVWGVSPGGLEHRPYWLRGGAGVVASLIRFYQVLKEERYLQLARKGAKGCAAFFSVGPHLFEGLASMGESLLDMFLVTGDTSYFELAQQKAAQILLYRIVRPQGIAFPGRFLLRISHDYGMGGAGIGMYLSRLMGLKPRRFHDLGVSAANAKAAYATAYASLP